MVKRLLCLFSAFIVLFSASVPAYAMGTLPIGFEVGLDVASLADLLVSGARIFGNSLASAFDSDVCGHAPQIGGGHKFVPQRTQVDGQIGLYYVCEYCGKTAGEVLDTTYTSYVETLPGTAVNSDGSFIWVMTLNSLVSQQVRVDANGGYVTNFPLDGTRFSQWVGGRTLQGFAVPGERILLTYPDYRIELRSFSFRAPFDGTYELVSGGFPFRTQFCMSGYDYAMGDYPMSGYGTGLDIAWPTFSITLLESMSDFGFSDDSRVSIDVSGDGSAGAYGYVENGQLVQSTVGTIYNETTNIYQNPVTGRQRDISKWTYDYSDRSYHLTTDDSDTVTVTYGDSNVTINEGGDTYTVYYLVEHEDIPEHDYVSTVTLAPTCTGTGVRTYTCTDCGDTYTETIPATGHSYQSAVTMPSSCTNTGVRTFTCSVCGDTYTSSIPATGHTWQVLQTVSTEYDQTGQLVREGYTIYQCSTCGEQYRITADSGGSFLPSPSSGGTSTGNTDLVEIDSSVGRGFLATIAHGLTEDLPAVLQACSQWFTEFPRFYSGFVAFLTDGVFSCYPAEYKLMMSFGIGMVTIIGIVRKLLGR